MSSFPARKRGFSLLKTPRSALEPTQSPTSWVLRLWPRLKPQRGKADHSPTPNDEITNEWSYTSTPPFALTARTDVFLLRMTWDFLSRIFRLLTPVKNPDERNSRLHFSKTLVSNYKNTRCHSQEVHCLKLYDLLQMLSCRPSLW
jgi:hypothetical protein